MKQKGGERWPTEMSHSAYQMSTIATHSYFGYDFNAITAMLQYFAAYQMAESNNGFQA